MPTAQTLDNRLDERIVERTEDIPADLEPGNYVVVDVLHFSNTVIELLANGASHVHVTEERGREFAYRRANPDARIGGSRTEAWTPTEGYDFFNSPSYVQGVDVAGVPASLWSSNGGRAVVDIRGRDRPDVDVYVGSTLNARALGEHLRGSERPTHIVAAGSKGDVAAEDLVGATLVSRYLDGLEPSRTERDVFRRLVRVAKGEDYVEKHPTRRRDVLEYAMDIGGRDVVPKLDGDAFVALDDAGTGTEAATGPGGSPASD